MSSEWRRLLIKENAEEQIAEKRWDLMIAPFSRTPMDKEGSKKMNDAMSRVSKSLDNQLEILSRNPSKLDRRKKFEGPVVSSYKVTLDYGDNGKDPLLKGLRR